MEGDEHESVSELCNENNATYDNHNTDSISGEIKVHSNYVLSTFTD